MKLIYTPTSALNYEWMTNEEFIQTNQEGVYIYRFVGRDGIHAPVIDTARVVVTKGYRLIYEDIESYNDLEDRYYKKWQYNELQFTAGWDGYEYQLTDEPIPPTEGEELYDPDSGEYITL